MGDEQDHSEQLDEDVLGVDEPGADRLAGEYPPDQPYEEEFDPVPEGERDPEGQGMERAAEETAMHVEPD